MRNVKPFFVNILDNSSLIFIFDFIRLLKKYKHRLFDDGNMFNDIKSIYRFIISLNGFLWLIIDPSKNKLAGFIFLDGFWANGYGVDISACFDKAYFGEFVRESGKIIIPHIFKTYNIKKLSAQVYSSNIQATKLLYDLGFKYDGTLKKHTIVNNKVVDVICFYITS